MTSDLGSALIGVSVGVLLPLAFSTKQPRQLGIVATGALALWGCGPILDQWEGWAITGCAIVTAAVVSVGRTTRGRVLRALVGLAVVLGLVIVLFDAGDAWNAVDDILGDDGTLVVVAGALLATLLGGVVIGAVLRPLAGGLKQSEDERTSLVDAGRFIGWLERALLYGFIVAGAPEAAALVVAAKSIARFPSFKEERFAEYYLIGTLLSVLIATGMAIATRAILGLHPLLK